MRASAWAGVVAGARRPPPGVRLDPVSRTGSLEENERPLAVRESSALELRQAGTDPARGGAEAGATQQRGDRRRGNLDAELLQLPADPHVTPARVLAPQPYHQRSGLPAERWSARFALRARRSPANELPMPAAQRVRADQQAGPSLSAEKQR